MPPLPALPQEGWWLRQELRYRHGAAAGGLEVIVQSRCGELLIVGLAPFGAPAFRIAQRAAALEAELALPGAAWPFAPEHIARDVHRAFLVPLPHSAPAQGSRELRYGGERVRERWARGALRERWLVPDTGAEQRGVAIEYRDGATREQPARELRLENLDLGYVLEVSTREYRRLSCDSAPH